VIPGELPYDACLRCLLVFESAVFVSVPWLDREVTNKSKEKFEPSKRRSTGSS
jgi:hypothetical protein